MASVFLDFVPPDKPDLLYLRIFEAPDIAGPYTEIEAVTTPALGTYGSYISSYTTDQATADDNWFAIQWEDSKGWQSDLSQPVQGDTTTVVGEVLQRVMQRRPTANEMVALNTVEAVVEFVFNQDPYTVDFSTVTYRQLEGMAMLSLAFISSVEIASGTTTRYTAGLVSQETGAQTAQTDTKALFNLAYRWLGISQSRIMQMEEIVVAAGARTTVLDQSRLLLTESL